MPPWSLIKVMLWQIILPSAFLAFCISFVIPRRMLVALALLTGLVICNYFNKFLAWWPETMGWDMLLPILFLALILVNFLTVPKSSPIRWWLLRAATVGLLAAIFLVESDLPFYFRGGLGLCCFALQLQLEKAQELVPRWLLTGLLSLTGLAASLVAHVQALKPADVGLVMFAAWAGLTLTALKKKLDLRIAFSISSLAIPCLLLTSRFYDGPFTECKIPWASFLLVALAPLSSVIAYLPERWSNSARLQYASMSILWIFFLILAVSFAARAEKMEF